MSYMLIPLAIRLVDLDRRGPRPLAANVTPGEEPALHRGDLPCCGARVPPGRVLPRAAAPGGPAGGGAHPGPGGGGARERGQRRADAAGVADVPGGHRGVGPHAPDLAAGAAGRAVRLRTQCDAGASPAGGGGAAAAERAGQGGLFPVVPERRGGGICFSIAVCLVRCIVC